MLVIDTLRGLTVYILYFLTGRFGETRLEPFPSDDNVRREAIPSRVEHNSPQTTNVSESGQIHHIAASIIEAESAGFRFSRECTDMFWTTSVILFAFWLLGVSVPFTAGGYIHILLGMTLVMVVIQLIRRRRDVARMKRRYEGAFQLEDISPVPPRNEWSYSPRASKTPFSAPTFDQH